MKKTISIEARFIPVFLAIILLFAAGYLWRVSSLGFFSDDWSQYVIYQFRSPYSFYDIHHYSSHIDRPGYSLLRYLFLAIWDFKSSTAQFASIVTHAINYVVLLIFFKKLFKKINPIPLFISSLFFLFAPCSFGYTVWLCAAFDSLSTTFFLSSCIFLISYIESKKWLSLILYFMSVILSVLIYQSYIFMFIWFLIFLFYNHSAFSFKYLCRFFPLLMLIILTLCYYNSIVTPKHIDISIMPIILYPFHTISNLLFKELAIGNLAYTYHYVLYSCFLLVLLSSCIYCIRFNKSTFIYNFILFVVGIYSSVALVAVTGYAPTIFYIEGRILISIITLLTIYIYISVNAIFCQTFCNNSPRIQKISRLLFCLFIAAYSIPFCYTFIYQSWNFKQCWENQQSILASIEARDFSTIDYTQHPYVTVAIPKEYSERFPPFAANWDLTAAIAWKCREAFPNGSPTFYPDTYSSWDGKTFFYTRRAEAETQNVYRYDPQKHSLEKCAAPFSFETAGVARERK